MNQQLFDLNPHKDDLLVIPETMILEDEGNLPFLIHRMKYLHKPSVVRTSGAYFMNAGTFSPRSILSWLGGKTTEANDPFSANDHQAGDLSQVLGNVIGIASSSRKDRRAFYKHIRVYDSKEVHLSCNSGATLYIEIDYEKRSLEFSFSLCHNRDHYNKSIGRKIAKARFDNGIKYCLTDIWQQPGSVVVDIEKALADVLGIRSSNGPTLNKMPDSASLFALDELYERIAERVNH